jgi:hypothetical protein
MAEDGDVERLTPSNEPRQERRDRKLRELNVDPDRAEVPPHDLRQLLARVPPRRRASARASASSRESG